MAFKRQAPPCELESFQNVRNSHASKTTSLPTNKLAISEGCALNEPVGGISRRR